MGCAASASSLATCEDLWQQYLQEIHGVTNSSAKFKAAEERAVAQAARLRLALHHERRGFLADSPAQLGLVGLFHRECSSRRDMDNFLDKTVAAFPDCAHDAVLRCVEALWHALDKRSFVDEDVVSASSQPRWHKRLRERWIRALDTCENSAVCWSVGQQLLALPPCSPSCANADVEAMVEVWCSSRDKWSAVCSRCDTIERRLLVLASYTHPQRAGTWNTLAQWLLRHPEPTLVRLADAHLGRAVQHWVEEELLRAEAPIHPTLHTAVVFGIVTACAKSRQMTAAEVAVLYHCVTVLCIRLARRPCWLTEPCEADVGQVAAAWEACVMNDSMLELVTHPPKLCAGGNWKQLVPFLSPEAMKRIQDAQWR